MLTKLHEELQQCIAEAKNTLDCYDLSDAERIIILESCLTDVVNILKEYSVLLASEEVDTSAGQGLSLFND